MPKVCVIIPTLNEAEAIGKVIDEVPKDALNAMGHEVEITVVDGLSADGTQDIAKGKGVRLLVDPTKRGKGSGMRTAFAMMEGDFIFMLDGDYTYPAGNIIEMLKLLSGDTCSVVTGSRLIGEREQGSLTKLNVLGNRLLTMLANILYGTKSTDLCTGLWGFRGDVIPSLDLTADGFTLEADLFTEVVRKGYAMREIPIYYRCRDKSDAKLSPITDGLKIGWAVLKKRFRRQGCVSKVEADT